MANLHKTWITFDTELQESVVSNSSMISYPPLTGGGAANPSAEACQWKMMNTTTVIPELCSCQSNKTGLKRIYTCFMSLITCTFMTAIIHLHKPEQIWTHCGLITKSLMIKQKQIIYSSNHSFTLCHPPVTVQSRCFSGSSPDHSGSDLSTEEDAQVADCMGGEHADDGKGDGEVLIQRTWAICRQSRRHVAI